VNKSKVKEPYKKMNGSSSSYVKFKAATVKRGNVP
jgi:hypothetical protein